MVKVIEIARGAHTPGLAARWLPDPGGRGIVCQWAADAEPWFAPVAASARRPVAPARPRRLMPRLLARAA